MCGAACAVVCVCVACAAVCARALWCACVRCGASILHVYNLRSVMMQLMPMQYASRIAKSHAENAAHLIFPTACQKCERKADSQATPILTNYI